MENIVADRQPILGEEVVMADGRVLERDYVPIYLFPDVPQPEDYRGHLWLYRDISDRKRTERELSRPGRLPRTPTCAKSDFLPT